MNLQRVFLAGAVAVLAFAVLAFAGQAQACRCEQQPLASYFDAAEVVAMARLVEAQPADGRIEFRFELFGDAYKGRPESGEELLVSTAASSAECGVTADIGGMYVLFGIRIEGVPGLSVDSCSGTRVHFSNSLDEPQGFTDVPARFVARQLIALQAMAVLGQVSGAAPQPEDSNNESLIGLLDLKALAHGGSTAARSAPDSDAPVLTVVDSYDGLVSREVGYEVPAAAVFAALPGWYKIRHDEAGFVWVAADDAGTYFGYDTLPVRRLTYLTGEWSGLVWPGPGSGLPSRAFSARSARPAEQAVNILESTIIGGMPWFRVEVLDGEHCTSAGAKTRLGGWIPAYGANGQPNAWFYSRGC